MTVKTYQPPQTKDREAQGLNALLDYIHRERGLDGSQYKRNFLRRRLNVRKQVRMVDTYQSYLDILRSDSNEYDALIDALSINLSYFFRDEIAFDVLRNRVLIPLIKQRNQENKQRLSIWSVGCASGEEPYSVAMMLTDLLGEKLPQWNIRIQATDIDANALKKARQGIYPPISFQNLKANFIDCYFSRNEGQYVLHPAIRKMVIFYQRDLNEPMTMPRYDLIICRNLLIYYSRAHQEKFIQILFGSLEAGGYLMLGMAETLPQSFYKKLEAIDIRRRIFRKPTVRR